MEVMSCSKWRHICYVYKRYFDIFIFLFSFCPGIKINVPSGTAGDLICRLFLSKFPLWTSFVASVLNLTCVTLERYVGIMYPLRYKAIFTLRKAVFMVIMVWIIAFVTNIYMLYIFHEENGACIVKWPSTFIQIVDGVLNFVVIYFVPLVVMGISYYRIMKNLRENAIILRASEVSDKMAMELLEARKKVVKMLSTVVLTFAICWAPNQFMFVAYNLGWDLDFQSWYYHVSVLMAFCNSCMNPFIYAFKNDRYRKALQKAVCGRRCFSATVGVGTATVSIVNTEQVNHKRKEDQNKEKLSNSST